MKGGIYSPSMFTYVQVVTYFLVKTIIVILWFSVAIDIDVKGLALVVVTELSRVTHVGEVWLEGVGCSLCSCCRFNDIQSLLFVSGF